MKKRPVLFAENKKAQSVQSAAGAKVRSYPVAADPAAPFIPKHVKLCLRRTPVRAAYGKYSDFHGNGCCDGFAPYFPLIRQERCAEPYACYELVNILL